MCQLVAEDAILAESLAKDDLTTEERKQLEEGRKDVREELLDELGIVGRHSEEIGDVLMSCCHEEAVERLRKRRERLALKARVNEVRKACKKLKDEWMKCDEEGSVDLWYPCEIEECLEQMERAAKRQRSIEEEASENE